MMSCNSMGSCGNGCNDSLRHIEQIALNKGAIDCLEGRVCRNEAEIKERYTKAEFDRMLEGKLDKCAFEKHLIKCRETGSCDCGDIPDPCDCDCYTKAETDELLSKKANIGRPQKYKLQHADGIEGSSDYYVNAFGETTIKINATSQTVLAAHTTNVIAQLPDGVAPDGVVFTVGTGNVSSNELVIIYVDTDHLIKVVPQSDTTQILGTISYLTAQ